MRLYRLGRVPWPDTQLLYHALAYLGRPGLILCSPSEPYVSVGYSQDPAHELDLAHCARAGLPVFRREVGGGAVYLDGHQIFWQVVLGRGHDLVSLNRQRFYQRLLEPVIEVYRALGVPARLAPVNDVAVGRRRIAGTGAGEIGDCVAFVGNVMRRFDCAAMARVINAPGQGFRRAFESCMQEQLTSLRRELGPERESGLADEDIHDLLAERFAEVLGPLEPAEVDGELRGAADDLGRRMLSRDWIFHPRKPRPLRRVKVRAGLFLHHWEHAWAGSRLRVRFTSADGRVAGITARGPWEDLGFTPAMLTGRFLGREARGLLDFLGVIARWV